MGIIFPQPIDCAPLKLTAKQEMAARLEAMRLAILSNDCDLITQLQADTPLLHRQYRDTPMLYIALEHAREKTVQHVLKLMERVDVNMNVLQLAIRHNHPSVFKYLVQQEDALQPTWYQSLIHETLARKNTDALEYLLFELPQSHPKIVIKGGRGNDGMHVEVDGEIMTNILLLLLEKDNSSLAKLVDQTINKQLSPFLPTVLKNQSRKMTVRQLVRLDQFLETHEVARNVVLGMFPMLVKKNKILQHLGHKADGQATLQSMLEHFVFTGSPVVEQLADQPLMHDTLRFVFLTNKDVMPNYLSTSNVMGALGVVDLLGLHDWQDQHGNTIGHYIVQRSSGLDVLDKLYSIAPKVFGQENQAGKTPANLAQNDAHPYLEKLLLQSLTEGKGASMAMRKM